MPTAVHSGFLDHDYYHRQSPALITVPSTHPNMGKYIEMARRHSPIAWLVPGILLALCQCTWRGALWIMPGSTASHLVFQVAGTYESSEPIVVRDISVFQRRDTIPQTNWSLCWKLILGDTPSLSVIEYGTTKYRSVPESSPAQPLGPGYYEVTVSYDRGRHAETDFVVTSDGSVVEHRID